MKRLCFVVLCVLIALLASGQTNRSAFSHSLASSHHSVVLCVRAGAINWKTAEGGSLIPSPVTPNTTSDYRAYAFRRYLGATFDV